jgi:hypothetical protein
LLHKRVDARIRIWELREPLQRQAQAASRLTYEFQK